MKNFLSRFKLKSSSYFNLFLTFFLLTGIVFSVIRIVTAVAPDPGHNFTESSGGIAQGDIVYGSATDVLSSLAKNTTATRYLANTGTSNNPAWGQVNLTNGVTGVLPVANGGAGIVYNQSVAAQGAGFATDTYLTGSSIAIPSGALKAGTRYHLVFQASKTAAGTATPILNIRFGTGGTTSDTSRCTLTFTAQTAATDTGTFEVWTTFRTVGSGTSTVLQCVGQRRHGASVTGFGTLVSETQATTSGGFDGTVGSSLIGTSVNGGTSAAWTVTLVQAELTNTN